MFCNCSKSSCKNSNLCTCKRAGLLCSEVCGQCSIKTCYDFSQLSDDESEDEFDIDDKDEHEVKVFSEVHATENDDENKMNEFNLCTE